MKPHLTWPQLLFIQCGGALCLPVFAIGAELRLTVGILPAVLAIVAGNFLLLIIARPIVRYATQCRQNTPQILSSFVHGGKLCAIVFMLNLVGWYGINNILLARALNSLLGTSTLLTLTSLGCLLPLIASKGPHRLAFVAKWTMPVMLVLLAFKADWRIETLTSSHTYIHYNLLPACGIVVLGMIAAVFDFPTYFSQSRSIKDSERATTLLLFLCVPALEIFGAFCGHTLFTQKGQAFNTLLGATPLALLIALAAITTNICNFYSARIFLETLAPRISKINITLLLAVSGFILSLAGQHVSYAHLLAAVSAPLMILVGVFYLFLFWKKK